MQAEKWKSLYQALDEKRLCAMLVTGMPNVRYISGFTGSEAALVVGRGLKVFLTDSRYTEQAREQARGFRIVTFRKKVEDIAAFIRKAGIKRLGFEPQRMSHDLYTDYRKRLSGLKLVTMQGEIEALRARKSREEIKSIAKAAKIAEKAFKGVLPLIRPGVMEKDIALELEYLMRKAGSGPPAFETIVASGKRAALPHGVASRKRLKKGEMVVMDFGASFEGYFSDQTITLSIGRPTARLRQVYEVVREAQKQALESIRHRVSAKSVDAVARERIAAAGMDRFFQHGLGHGVGLEVHESPSLSRMSEYLLEKDMIVTVEPGIYIPGWGGVRIEDLVVVTERGCRRLTCSSGPLRVIL